MKIGSRSAGELIQPLLAIAERRLPALTRLRKAESLPIQLHRRRIYVLPSLFGIGFAALLVIMQLGALNYSNNPALLLTCVLAGAAWMSLFAGFRALAGLELVSITAADAHAGAALDIQLGFAASARARPSLRARWAEQRLEFSLPRGIACHVTLQIPAPRRGWYRPGRLKLWTEQPLGLFVIWSWLNPDLAFLVYPQAEPSPPPWPISAGQRGNRHVPGDGEDFSGLRDYRSGDPQRQIAWKASARHDSLLVRESERQIDDQLHFDFASLHGLDREQRISRLTAWVLAAEDAMQSYSLDLGDQVLPAGLGSQHRDQCLRALALLPDAP